MARISKKQQEAKQTVVEKIEEQEHFVPEFPENELKDPLIDNFDDSIEDHNLLGFTDDKEPKENEHQYDDFEETIDELKQLKEEIESEEHDEELLDDEPIDPKFLQDAIQEAYDDKAGFDRKPELKVEIVCNVNGFNVGRECRIEMKANPKRPNSKAYERYSAYEKSKNIGEYLDAGGLKADLRYDQMKGHMVLIEAVRDGHIVVLPVKK